MCETAVWRIFSKVRVKLDWPRVVNDELKIDVHHTSSLNEVRTFFMPWYADDNRTELRYDCDYAKPVTVGDVADDLDRWPQRTLPIAEYVKDMCSDGAQGLVLPTYALPNDRLLLLDGNHRAVALVVAQIPFSVRLLIVRGPIEPTMLPDLKHWAKH